MNSSQSVSDGLTVIIPCFNESHNLPKLLAAIIEVTTFSPQIEFVIVENGSTDGSRKILQDMEQIDRIKVLYLNENHGYGSGIISGIKLSQTYWTGWIHADLQIPLESLTHAIKSAQETGRPVKGSRKGRSISDRMFTLGMSIVCSLLFHERLSDINGQPTIYPTRFLHSFGEPPQDFSLDLFFYIQALKLGYKIERFAVHMSPRVDGQSSWNTGLMSRILMVKRTLRFAFQLRKTLSQ